MSMPKSVGLFIMMWCFLPFIQGQDTTARKLNLDGYISFRESAMDLNVPGENLFWESLINNRLNLFYFPSTAWTLSIQVRNRLMRSEMLEFDFTDTYRRSLAEDIGVIDLSWNLLSEKSTVFNTAIDRLWVKYSLKRMEITAGRQRINWGQTYVWNPNDWFNNYSLFDVDYFERPGSDALRIQYFTNAISSLEAAIKFNSSNDFTVAGLFKTNVHEYDLQFLGGILDQEDLALGFGWAGGLGQVGFRGETSYLHPLNSFADTTGLFCISVALDYTFTNSLMIQAEGLYNQLPKVAERKSFIELYARPLTVKNLSFTEFNYFVQVSYPFTPLFKGSIAILYYPDIDGYYIGPTLTYSLASNLDLAFFGQHFSGRFYNIFGMQEKQNFTMGFLRVKYNF